jgi:hypothetical protein
LRADLHRLAVQIVMPLDGIIDSFESSNAEEDAARDQGFAFILENCRRIPNLVTRLGRLAKHDFEHFDGVARAAAPGRQAPESTPNAAARTPIASSSE